MALRHGGFSARQLAAHWVQHVGADGYRPGDRRFVRFGAIFFAFLFTGVFGYVVSAAFGHFSIGASGGLLGLIGLLLAITTRRSNSGLQMLRKQLIYWLVYIAVLGFLFRGTDNAAHAGGFVAGFALGKILNDRRPAGISEERRAQAMGWIAGIAVAASFAMMLLSYFQGQG